VCPIEERTNLDSISMDEIHRIFIAYEMRTKKENQIKKEATLKASKKSKKKSKKKENSDSSSSSSGISKDDEEVANFVRRVKKGTDKCRGKIPLICFNCDAIGHFSKKCPHKKKKRNEEDYSNNKHIIQRKKNQK
jgi:hypothetical protein